MATSNRLRGSGANARRLTLLVLGVVLVLAGVGCGGVQDTNPVRKDGSIPGGRGLAPTSQSQKP